MTNSEIFHKATAKAVDIDMSEEIPGQGRHRKGSGRFNHGSTSANKDHLIKTPHTVVLQAIFHLSGQIEAGAQ